MKIPLLIAVVATFDTCYGSEELESILFGQHVNHIIFERTTNRVVSQTASRKNDGLFAEKPFLSGAIRAWSPQVGKWQMQYYSNPQAENSLPENIFIGQ